MTRDERRAATRTELLDAAAKVFARRGFHGASVDDVAAEAGYTSGAVYSHFRNKEDIFLAAFEHSVLQNVREMTEARDDASESSAGDRTRAIAAKWMQMLDRSPQLFMLLVEYWAYAMRDPKMRSDFSERFGAFRDVTARMIEQEAARGGWELPEPAEELAVGINALVYGIALQALASPDETPDDLLAKQTLRIFAAIREERNAPPGRKRSAKKP